jgi:hypothetical protein
MNLTAKIESDQTKTELAMKLLLYSKSPMADRRTYGSSYLKAHAAHGVDDVNTVGVPRQINQFRLGPAKGCIWQNAKTRRRIEAAVIGWREPKRNQR